MPGLGQNRTAEFELLAACSAWPLDEKATRRIASESFQANFNWNAFIALAERHRVTALTLNALRTCGVGVEEAAARRLQSLARQEAFRELTLAGEAVGITHSLADMGVRAILLKGISVALLGFGRLGLRTNRDIDLLVNETLLGPAEIVLTQRGYIRIEPAGPLSPAALQQWVALHKDMVFRNQETGIIVEVHWRLFDNPHLLPVPTFADTSGLFYAGEELCVMTPSLNVIYLCLHGMQHAWSRMKWLADLGAVLSTMTQAEIAATYLEARRRGLHVPVAASFSLCQEVLGSSIPEIVSRFAARGWRERLLKKVALSSLTTGGAVEMEDRNFGSTWKNISHYLFRLDYFYWVAELKYDLLDDPTDHSPGGVARLILRIPRWIIRQSHRGAASGRIHR